MAAQLLAAEVPAAEWQCLSAGEGAIGPRFHEWARVPIRALPEPGGDYWLLVRRGIADPTDRASYVCFGPAEAPLPELVGVAGARWAIEESLETAKGEGGLDQYEVRRWPGWYRPSTRVALAPPAPSPRQTW